MKKMDHPNIVKLYELIDDPDYDKIYLVMDYVKKGAVLSKGYWKNELREQEPDKILNYDSDDSQNNTFPKRLSNEKAKKYFRHLILGLDYLHNYAHVVHRDIKPENLLVDENDFLKISDFGISHVMEDGADELKNNSGTKYFLGPEAWTGSSYRGKPADIWAAGATLYYFFYGKAPFRSTRAEELKRKIMEEEPEFEDDEFKINPKVKGLI
mmetsp:Transcript_3267/g.2822  ORF Transcript_3267/g.2822 Transcript_3267/m.2822 type:complete len:211 (-) Transcript_3267:238-870(-)